MNYCRIKKIASRFLLLLCILSLPAILSSYLYKQKLLVIESNHLLTPKYIQGNEEMKRIWKEKLTASHNIWLIGLLGYSDQIRVMSIYAQDFRNIYLPVKNGEMFTEADGSKAIIGIDVPTARHDGKQFYQYNGRNYGFNGNH